MIIQCVKTDFIKQDDNIAITRNDTLIGYGIVIAVLEEHVLLKIDDSASRSMSDIFSQNIDCSFTFINQQFSPKNAQSKEDC